MSFGKLVVRHGFYDFEHVPFDGENISAERRASSAPPILLRKRMAAIDKSAEELHLQEAEDKSSQELLTNVNGLNFRLARCIQRANALNEKSREVLNLVRIYKSKGFNKPARSLVLSLSKSYGLNVEALLMKMLFGVLNMHRDRVARFVAEIKAQKPIEDFHLQFCLDAHGEGGVTNYLLFSARAVHIRWFKVGRRGRHLIDPTGANEICAKGDVVCLKRVHGLFWQATDKDTTGVARERWTKLRQYCYTSTTPSSSSSSPRREGRIVHYI